MRPLFLCAAALVACCSAAHAERIHIEAAAATYFTQTDTVEFKAWLSAPLEIPGDYFAVGGWIDHPDGSRETFSFRNSSILRDNVFAGHAASYDTRGELVSRVVREGAALDLDGRLVSLSIPFAHTGLSRPLFDFNVVVDGGTLPNGLDSFYAVSSIDNRVIYTPEPSTVALLGIAAVHLLWLPRLRKRFGKRHVAGQSNRIDG